MVTHTGPVEWELSLSGYWQAWDPEGRLVATLEQEGGWWRLVRYGASGPESVEYHLTRDQAMRALKGGRKEEGS